MDNKKMRPVRKNRFAKRNRLIGIALIAFTILLVVGGNAVSDDGEVEVSVSETRNNSGKDSAENDMYPENPDDKKPSVPNVDPESEPEEVTSSTQAPTEQKSTAPDNTSSSAESSTKKDETTKKTTYSSKGNTAASEYAYAGFNPVVTDTSGNWETMLINKNYCLPEGYSVDLAEALKGTGYRLDSRVAPHYQKMYDAAAEDGIYLTPVSGYRSVDKQKTNFSRKINYYMDLGYDKVEATKKASMIIFLPGASEHNAGLAMDIISLDTDFDQTKAFRWLSKNASDYGFIMRYPKDKTDITGATYEPWHWRYVGVDVANAMKSSGQCLEEYLGVYS